MRPGTGMGPGRFGKPIGDMKHFVKEVNLPSGGKYAVLVTELRPKSSNGLPPAPVEGSGKCQQVIPFMDAALQKKGLIKIAEGKVFVTGLKGPLEEGWRDKVAAYASRIAVPTRA